MGKIKLRGKLFGAFGVMALMLLVGGIIGTFGISYISGKLRNVSQNQYMAIYALGKISEYQSQIYRLKMSLLVPENFNNTAQKEKLLSDNRQAWSQIEPAIKEYDQLPRVAEADALWKKLKSSLDGWQKSNQEFVSLVNEGKRDDAWRVLNAGLLTSTLLKKIIINNRLVEKHRALH